MSGSGGGGVPDTGPEVTDCASLTARTALNSPNQAVLKTLNTKSILTVQLREPDKKIVVAVTADGKIAGSITYAGVARLAACLSRGYKYVALVVSIDGGDCRVEIRPGASRA